MHQDKCVYKTSKLIFVLQVSHFISENWAEVVSNPYLIKINSVFPVNYNACIIFRKKINMHWDSVSDTNKYEMILN